MHKILYLNSSNELYGADRSLFRLVSSLNKEKYKPYVIVPNDLDYEGHLTRELILANIDNQETNLAVLRRKYLNPAGIFRILYSLSSSHSFLTEQTKLLGVNLIHSNTAAVLSGAGVSKTTKIPHIWHLREIITNPTWLRYSIGFMLQNFADKVIAVSGPVRNSMVSIIPSLANKIEIIHNGIDPNHYAITAQKRVEKQRLSWGASKSDTIIGTIGRISPGKGQEYLVNACRSVFESSPRAKLIIVGGSVPGDFSYKKRLINLISASGFRDRIIIEDFQTNIVPILSAFDIFVLPSTHPEAFPTSVLEAMAAMKPVIATAHGGPTEQIVADETGLFVTPNDENDMAMAIQLLINNPSLRQKMGSLGRKRLHNYFTKDKYVKNIEDIYNRILH